MLVVNEVGSNMGWQQVAQNPPVAVLKVHHLALLLCGLQHATHYSHYQIKAHRGLTTALFDLNLSNC